MKFAKAETLYEYLSDQEVVAFEPYEAMDMHLRLARKCVKYYLKMEFIGLRQTVIR